MLLFCAQEGLCKWQSNVALLSEYVMQRLMLHWLGSIDNILGNPKEMEANQNMRISEIASIPSTNAKIDQGIGKYSSSHRFIKGW